MGNWGSFDPDKNEEPIPFDGLGGINSRTRMAVRNALAGLIKEVVASSKLIDVPSETLLAEIMQAANQVLKERDVLSYIRLQRNEPGLNGKTSK